MEHAALAQGVAAVAFCGDGGGAHEVIWKRPRVIIVDFEPHLARRRLTREFTAFVPNGVRIVVDDPGRAWCLGCTDTEFDPRVSLFSICPSPFVHFRQGCGLDGARVNHGTRHGVSCQLATKPPPTENLADTSLVRES